MIWTINRIRQNFRTTRNIKFSTKTIRHFAEDVAGYHLQRKGGLIGYDKSVYTRLTQLFPEMVKYQNEKDIRKAQKASKREIDYNPDKFIEPEDRVDYDWEKNESRNMRKKMLLEGPQIVNNLDLAIRIIKNQWESPDDYWYVKIIQRNKDNSNVVDRDGKSIFSKKGKTWLDGRNNENKIGYVVVKGETVNDAIDSLINPKVTIFDSWVDFIGQKVIQSNDNKFGAIIEVCRAFNARAYMAMYKKSFSDFSNRDAGTDLMTPKVYQALRGDMSPSARERVFDHITNHTRMPSVPFWLVDCDDEDEVTQEKVLDYMYKEFGLKPIDTYKSHGGVHYLLDFSKITTSPKEMQAIADDMNAFFKTLYPETPVKEKKKGEIAKTQSNPIEVEHNKNIILYSEVGIPGRNVPHPEWQKNTIYPVPELRSKLKVKEAVRYSIRKFLLNELKYYDF